MCCELIKENDLGEFQTGVNKDSKVILFTNYREECEEYYCERDEDKDFIKHLDVNNIWIFGKSGKGKTTLINRNLLYNKIEYLFCDMSPITIKSENDVLEDILSTIEDKFDITRDPNQKNIIKSIVSLLNSLKNKQIVIVIDEMSIADQTVLKEVASSFLMLVTHYVNKREDRNLKFVVSTISEPKDLLINAAKATDYFQYICCDNWDDHMNKLFDSLVSVLELYVVKEDRSFIIKESNKSPRVLKNILRKMVVCEDLNSTKIKEIVQRTLEESL
jgi:DNA replication protein DnaC